MNKIIKIKAITIKYKGNETTKEVYKVTLNNINQMVHGVGSNPKLLEELRLYLMNTLAVVINRQEQNWLKHNGY